MADGRLQARGWLAIPTWAQIHWLNHERSMYLELIRKADFGLALVSSAKWLKRLGRLIEAQEFFANGWVFIFLSFIPPALEQYV